MTIWCTIHNAKPEALKLLGAIVSKQNRAVKSFLLLIDFTRNKMLADRRKVIDRD
jgi:hypothetical protein